MPKDMNLVPLLHQAKKHPKLIVFEKFIKYLWNFFDILSGQIYP